MKKLFSIFKILFDRNLSIKAKENFGPPVLANANWVCGNGDC
ncbi:MAG: hypothetical protein ACLSBL_03420 [Ezakiella massiliensis]